MREFKTIESETLPNSQKHISEYYERLEYCRNVIANVEQYEQNRILASKDIFFCECIDSIRAVIAEYCRSSQYKNITLNGVELA